MRGKLVVHARVREWPRAFLQLPNVPPAAAQLERAVHVHGQTRRDGQRQETEETPGFAVLCNAVEQGICGCSGGSISIRGL